jgi:hypothetical protein
MKKGKKSRATVPLRQVFGFQRNRQLVIFKIILS